MKIKNFLLAGAVGMLCAVGLPQQASANALTDLGEAASLDVAAIGTEQTTQLARHDKHPRWDGRDSHQPPKYDKHKKPPKPPKHDKHKKPPKPPKPPKHDRHDKPMPPYGHH